MKNLKNRAIMMILLMPLCMRSAEEEILLEEQEDANAAKAAEVQKAQSAKEAGPTPAQIAVISEADEQAVAAKAQADQKAQVPPTADQEAQVQARATEMWKAAQEEAKKQQQMNMEVATEKASQSPGIVASMWSMLETLSDALLSLPEDEPDSEEEVEADEDKINRMKQKIVGEIRKEYPTISSEKIKAIVNDAVNETENRVNADALNGHSDSEQSVAGMLSSCISKAIGVVSDAAGQVTDALTAKNAFMDPHGFATEDPSDDAHQDSEKLVADQDGQNPAEAEQKRLAQQQVDAARDAQVKAIFDGYQRQLVDLFSNPDSLVQVDDLADNIAGSISRKEAIDRASLKQEVKQEMARAIDEQAKWSIMTSINKLIANCQDWIHQIRTGLRRQTIYLDNGKNKLDNGKNKDGYNFKEDNPYTQEVYEQDPTTKQWIIKSKLDCKSATNKTEMLYVKGTLSRTIVTDATSKTDSYYNGAGKVRIAIKYDVAGTKMQELIFYQKDGTMLQQTISFDEQSNITVKNYDEHGKEIVPAKEKKDEKMIGEEPGQGEQVESDVDEKLLISPDALAKYMKDKASGFVAQCLLKAISVESLAKTLAPIIQKYKFSSDSDVNYIKSKVPEIYESYPVLKQALTKEVLENQLNSFIKELQNSTSEYTKLAASKPFEKQ